MSETVERIPVLTATEQLRMLKKKKALIEVVIVKGSDHPFRLKKKRTGVTLGSFETMLKLERFLEDYPYDKLAAKPTKGPRRY